MQAHDAATAARPESAVSEKEAGLPPFSIGAVEFVCHVVGEGGPAYFVWLSGCRRARVGQRAAGPFKVLVDGELVDRMVPQSWARVDGRLLGDDFKTLKVAMIAAAAQMAIASRAADQKGAAA